MRCVVIWSVIFVVASLLSACGKISGHGVTCLDPDRGRFLPLQGIINDYANGSPTVFGVGLTYQSHIDEVRGLSLPDGIPVFLKNVEPSVGAVQVVSIPTREQLVKNLKQLDPELNENDKNIQELEALLDYEVELGIILLEDPDWNRLASDDYVISVGFFLANDLSARSIAILGEGTDEAVKYRYWGASKSFPGFLPVGEKVFIVRDLPLDQMLCVDIVLSKNGNRLQGENTGQLIFSLRELLEQIRLATEHRGYPDILPGKGDMILTGTPGGVVIGTTPIVFRYLADLLGSSGKDRLKSIQKKQKKSTSNRSFLRAGDVIVMDGGLLGKVRITFSGTKVDAKQM